MEQRKRTWTSKLIGVAGAFGLTFAMACATTTETDPYAEESRSDRVAEGETVDPLGPPQHIESEVTHQHPSSNTGAGNAQSAGANTNLNEPRPEPTVTQSDAEVTETRIVEERPVIEDRTVVEPTPEPTRIETRTTRVETVVEDEEEVVTRRVTRKE